MRFSIAHLLVLLLCVCVASSAEESTPERHYSPSEAFLAGRWSSLADSLVSTLNNSNFLDSTAKLNLLLSRSSREHLQAVLDKYAAKTAKLHLTSVQTIVRSRFLYVQLLRAGREDIALDVLRRSHAVQRYSYLPPLLVREDSGLYPLPSFDSLTPLSRQPAGAVLSLGNMYDPKHKRLAVGGFSFELDEPAREFELYLRSNVPLRVSFDSAILKRTENGIALDDDLTMVGEQMLLDPFGPAYRLSASELEEGRHVFSFATQLNRPCSISVFAYCDGGQITALPLRTADILTAIHSHAPY